MTSTAASTLERAVAELGDLLGDRVSTAAAVRDHHSRGELYFPPAPPDVVVFPSTTDEVSRIVRICAAHRVPMIPFGAGTSLEGHVSAVRGGVSIDLTGLHRVLRLSVDDLDATVEAGVTRGALVDHLKGTGLTFFLDPGADATIGGMVATGASGTTAVRYGTIRENVLGLTVVLADGSVIRTGGRARKSSSGYDLTRLFIGSEGTLGVVTEVTLRLQPLPDAISAAVAAFESIEGAVDAVIMAIQVGIPVARAELMDERSVAALNQVAGLGLPVAPTVFFEFHGPTERAVQEQAELVEGIAAEHGGRGFRWATSLEERNRLWKARHEAAYSALQLRPGAKMWATDVCVPLSRLAECIRETRADNDASSLIGPILGHIGDGNFHCGYLFDPANPAEVAEARRLNDRLVARALAMGGTCTGEHGIGLGKMASLEQEHGDLIPTMRAIKRALDPHDLMNPGKIFRLEPDATYR
jgi:D-lactate dehydrogenase (cytochrome)